MYRNNEILQAVVETCKNLEYLNGIIAFGGIGRGEMNENSDYDLIFIIQQMNEVEMLSVKLKEKFHDSLVYSSLSFNKFVMWVGNLQKKLDFHFCTSLDHISKFIVCSEMFIRHVEECLLYSRTKTIEETITNDLNRILGTERIYPMEYDSNAIVEKCVEIFDLYCHALEKGDRFKCEFFLFSCIKPDLVRLELLSKDMKEHLYLPKMAYKHDLETEKIPNDPSQSEPFFTLFLKMVKKFRPSDTKLLDFVNMLNRKAQNLRAIINE